MADQPFAPPPPPALFANSSLAPMSLDRSSSAGALGSIRDLLALTKPRLSSLVLVTAGGGMLLAPGHLRIDHALVALIATAMVVGAANALNSYLERDLDRHMVRTRERPLPARRLDPRIALVLAGALLVIAVPVLTFVINPITSLLGLLALASYVLVYTPMKQRSSLALWVGAVPGAIPPLMGWTAVRGRIEWPGLTLFAILFCWQITHFIAIALFRSDDYARAGHRILPAAVGVTASKVHATVWAVLLLACTLTLVPLGVEGRGYGVCAAVLGAGFVVWTALGFARRNVDARERWARGLFRGSLVYLTLLMVALSVGAR